MRALRDVGRRIHPAVLGIVCASAALLPGLGAFGLWEPEELGLAVQARDGAPLRLGRGVAAPLAAAGMRLVGTGEAGARLGAALCAVATIAALAWGAAGTLSRRGALLAALVLGTSPLFVLQARQVTSDMPLVLGLTLAMAGLARLVWPAAGGAARGAPVAAAAGLALGVTLGGALVGGLVPVAACAAALALAPPTPAAPRWVARAGRPALGAAAVAFAGLVLVGGTAGAGAWGLGVARQGTPGAAAPGLPFDLLLRTIGVGLFPWTGLVPFALARPLAGSDDGGRDRADTAAGGLRLFLLLFATLAFAAATLEAHLGGAPRRFAALAPFALAVAALLEGQLRAPRALPVLALAGAVGALLVGRDLALEPELLDALHLTSRPPWPVMVSVRPVALSLAALFAAGALLAFAPPDPGARRRARAAGLALMAGAALCGALGLAHGLVPLLSRHRSLASILDLYEARGAGAPLGRYGIDPAGTLGAGAAAPRLPDPAAVAAFLGGGRRAFVVAARSELSALDAALRRAGIAYAVLDARSTRALLLVAPPLPDAPDENPLRTHVFLPPPEAPAARPPWPAPGRGVRCVFGGAIELYGQTRPARVRRPARVTIELHYRVLAPPPPGHEIFIHLEAPGEPRVNGDHAPLAGAFPTRDWLPGEHVRDVWEIDLPRFAAPAGRYAIFTGFWPGGKGRLPITAGDRDAEDRCPLGTLEVR